MPPAFRLGLATRGNTHTSVEDVLLALDRGVNYWKWCGHDDGMSRAVRELGSQRTKIVLATQMSVYNWPRDEMRRELDRVLSSLETDW